MGDSAENFTCTVEDGFVMTPEQTPKAKITVQEHDYSILVQSEIASKPLLSVAEARELARRLYVLAKRVERKIG